MNKIKMRLWKNGGFLATGVSESGVKAVLEFDGRGRYHAVALRGDGWSESEFRLPAVRGSNNLSHFFKHSQAHGKADIVTHFQALTRAGSRSQGQTRMLADGSVRWEQKKVAPNGNVLVARGDGFSGEAELTTQDGQFISRMVRQLARQGRDETETTVFKRRDGTTLTTTEWTQSTPSGGVQYGQNTVVTNEKGGVISRESTSNTHNQDGSVDVSNSSSKDGITTTTTTHSDGAVSSSTTTVVDENTGDKVETQDKTQTSTDAQGSTITTNTGTVKSSDGFRTTQVNWSSTDGSSGSQGLTVEPDGSYTSTESVSDGAGNTHTVTTQGNFMSPYTTETTTDEGPNGTTQTVVSNSPSGTTVTNTSTDSSGTYTTTDTYDENGVAQSSQSSYTPAAPSGSGSGSGDSGGSSGGTSGSGGTGSGDNSGSGGTGSGDNSGSGGGSGSGDDSSAGTGTAGGSGGGSEMGNPDTGTDEGPRTPTGRASIGLTESGARGHVSPGGGGDPAFDGDPDGGDPSTRNSYLSKFLQRYVNTADEDGSGDASADNSAELPEVQKIVTLPAGAGEEGWGTFNNPRAMTAVTQTLLVSLRQSEGKQATGLSRALAANALVNARLTESGRQTNVAVG